MSGYSAPAPSRVSANSDHPDHYPIDESPGHAGGDRGDEEDMGSPSEHNSDQQYGGQSLADQEVPEDLHHALTNQSLNSDGTPKRPMNAFMIFARRRRPQVSAANQMMRTGEISKILSKEWNSMPMSEKQFYLDQAKKLKDNFNNKYPDYVYRRRPNNSRRKRRADNGLGRPYDGGGSAEHHDDSGSTEFDENSPVDLPANAPNHGGPLNLTETGALVVQPAPPSATALLTQPSIYTRHFPNDQVLSPTYDPGPASASSHSSSSSYAPYSQQQQQQGPFNDFGGYHGQAQSGHAPPRLQSLQTHLPWPHDNGPASSTSPITGGSSSSPGLPDSLQHHQYSSSSGNSANHLGTPHSPDDAPHHSIWGSSSLSSRGFDPPRSAGATGAPGTSGASSSSAWPMPPSLASVTGRQRALTTTTLPTISTTLPPPTLPSTKSELFSSPSIPHRAWSNTPSSGSSTSTASTTGPGSTGLQFQTLTAPFFPGGQSGSDARSASTSPQLSRDPYYSSGGPTRTESGYDHHHAPYPISPISPPHSSYFSHQAGAQHTTNGSSNSHMYSSAHNQHSRLLHPIQTFSGPHAHGTGPSSREMASPLSAGPHSAASHSGYWDRVEGR
ncbi:hypothetical protein SCHPADRAFT_938014 [Schizopora paradoxa]|uniref:HMG box domain-containing protein n=1 Tax=Schizopora paradoxa TaxID=27342 RepID=A0A0H2RW12_9AGAM|nr:hypothetical protein SCHPADRAFT_938014 [Schizopora paradoxa]